MMPIAVRKPLLVSLAFAVMLSGCGETFEPKIARTLPKLPEGAGPMDSDPPEMLTPSKTGIYYRVLRKGTGKVPQPTDTITVNYRGWLDSGREFDNSYAKGKPLAVPLSKLVAGWQEGLLLMNEGAMYELEIPPHLGYKEGARGIPAGSTLHFLVELLKTEPTPPGTE